MGKRKRSKHPHHKYNKRRQCNTSDDQSHNSDRHRYVRRRSQWRRSTTPEVCDVPATTRVELCTDGVRKTIVRSRNTATGRDISQQSSETASFRSSPQPSGSRGDVDIALRGIRVQYNAIYRILMKLPRFCSASTMFAEARVPDFFAIMRSRVATFWSRIRESGNEILSTLSERLDSPILKHWISVHRERNQR